MVKSGLFNCRVMRAPPGEDDWQPASSVKQAAKARASATWNCLGSIGKLRVILVQRVEMYQIGEDLSKSAT